MEVRADPNLASVNGQGRCRARASRNGGKMWEFAEDPGRRPCDFVTAAKRLQRRPWSVNDRACRPRGGEHVSDHAVEPPLFDGKGPGHGRAAGDLERDDDASRCGLHDPTETTERDHAVLI